MYIPKSMLSLPLDIIGYIAAIGVTVYAARKVSHKLSEKFVPTMGLCALFIFLLQLIPLPAIDSSGSQFIGAILAATLLGPWPGFLVISLVVALRSIISNNLGLAHLGLNIINLGWIAGVVGASVLAKLKQRVPHKRRGFLAAIAIASWVSIVMAASAVELELALFRVISGISRTESAWIMVNYILLGVVEAAITTGIISVVLSLRPDLVVGYCCGGEKQVCYAEHHHVQTHTHPKGDLGHHDYGHPTHEQHGHGQPGHTHEPGHKHEHGHVH